MKNGKMAMDKRSRFVMGMLVTARSPAHAVGPKTYVIGGNRQ